MRILKKILLVLIGLAVLLVLIGLVLPSSVHVERQTSIDAPQAPVFSLLNDLKRANEWSPWFEKDPAMKQTFTGPESGVGAKMVWDSTHPEVGKGSQEIVKSEAPRLIGIHLEFEGFGGSEASYTLSPEGAGTRVVWGYDCKFGYNLIGRYFGLLFDKMMGADFEKGLANLKTLAESQAKQHQAAAALQIEEVDVAPVDIAAVEGTTSLDPGAIGSALAAAYAQINSFMSSHELEAQGAPLAITRFYDESGWGFEAAIPFGAKDAARAKALAAAADGPVKLKQSYGGKALKGMHIGPYSDLPNAYRRLEDYLADKHLEANGQPWEQYISDPASTPQDKLTTAVYMPLKPAG